MNFNVNNEGDGTTEKVLREMIAKERMVNAIYIYLPDDNFIIFKIKG
jgi:hypothetical protein